MAKEYVPTQEEREVLSKILVRWEEAKGHHATFVRRYEKNEKAYRGVLEVASNASQWRHQVHPPYAFNLIETIVSNTEEMGLTFRASPSPRAQLSLDEAMEALQQVDAVEDLLRHEHRVDDMDTKQRPLFLMDAICGRGIGKAHWNWRSGSVRRQGWKMEPIYDAEENLVLEVPVAGWTEKVETIRDHSTLEVVDPRDFVTHESAKALQPFEPGGAQYLYHRCWYSFEQLKMMEAEGFIENVDYLGEARDYTSEYEDRQTEVFGTNRNKDLIQVLEYWCMENGQVHRALVGAEKVLLRGMETNPFAHGEYPFVICSSMPLPFTTVGMSGVELIAQLQEVLWELMNQRLDNIELINNFITLISGDVEDPLRFYPGAQWIVESPKDVETLQPPYQLAEVSVHAEALIRGDLQNVTSAAPFASGAETATVDQKTATGASIVMNAAQQQLRSKKYRAQWGLKDEANMRMKNCQQLLSDVRLAHIFGPDGRRAFREIDPMQIQGEFLFELTPMSESDMREQRRAETAQFLQTILPLAPHFMAGGAPLNMFELGKWFFENWGLDGVERFFSQQPQPAMLDMGGGQGGAPPPGGAAPTEPNLGITSDAAIDASSPSAAGGISASPITALQRASTFSRG